MGRYLPIDSFLYSLTGTGFDPEFDIGFDPYTRYDYDRQVMQNIIQI